MKAALGRLLLLSVGFLGRPSSSAEALLSFNKDIRPILSEHCFPCHGPDEKGRKGGVRLDLRETAIADNDGLFPILPGNPDKSEIVVRIRSQDEDVRMPPPEKGPALSREQVAALKTWIAQGANYERHWSLMPIPSVDVPDVADSSRVKNPIDAFIQSELEGVGLGLQPEADKIRLLRRVSFDLTGLPPADEEITEFLEDRSAGAYDRVVDRLLKSSAYGERMASEWLDVARYSDSYGYQVDRERFVWPWRDWVVSAFNENLGYDQFITWQIAGDLLPEAQDEMILATTFNRLHPQKVEGGSVPEEFRIEYVADRTQTIGTAFMGLTLECSRCHDHKYDPITQKDYYALSGFLSNIDEAGLYSYFTPAIPTPTLLLEDDARKVQRRQRADRVAALETGRPSMPEPEAALFQAWRDSLNGQSLRDMKGLVAYFDFDEMIEGKFPNLVNKEQRISKAEGNSWVGGESGKAIRLSGDDEVKLPLGNFRRWEPFSVSFWMQTPDIKERAVVFHRSRAWTDSGSRGYQVLLENGALSFSLIHFWPGNAMRIRMLSPLTPEEWTHVVVTYDGSSQAQGMAIYLNGEKTEVEVVRDHLYKHINGGGGDNIAIGARFRDKGFTGGLIDDFMVFDRAITRWEIGRLSGQSEDLANESRLLAFFRETKHSATRDWRQALKKARQSLFELVDGTKEIMVMKEMSPRRPAYLLHRGEYDQRQGEVSYDTPASLPPFPEGEPRNRLGLAKWLTAKTHPLTARVTVNRYWQLFFGRGLVTTPEDFGSQGKPPSHPDLLDWLAADFVDQGWDLKRLIKTMVTSQAYRQTSVATEAILAKDPENRLISRSPRYRLPAEMIRDNALAVSGLLDRTIGGPPAKPYELEYSFKPLTKDKGAGLYRRSLYTYWKRTAPAPVMMALDAAKRDVCMVKREATASPIQAFVLMNDPQLIEASRALAKQVLGSFESRDHEDIARQLFFQIVGRQPSSRELSLLADLLALQVSHFEASPEEANAFLRVGLAATTVSGQEEASWLAASAALANTLFMHDECVMKR